MSIFNELLPKIHEISNAFTKNFNDQLKAAFECFDKFEEEFQNGRATAREKGNKDKTHLTTLQSIHEDEDTDSPTQNAPDTTKPKSKDTTTTDIISISSETSEATSQSSSESGTEKRRTSKKRSKNEVDGMVSPEQDKRQKRNASVKAQSIISKQVNVNLTQKLRREDGNKSHRSRRGKEDNKENDPLPVNIQIKEEKISLPPEPEHMDTESLPLNIEVKLELNKDEIAMPPPAVPLPRTRKGAAKEKTAEDVNEEDSSSSRRRTTRTRKQTESMAPPPVPASRATRSSSRSTRATTEIEEPAPRPKRTRTKKKISETTTTTTDSEKESLQAPQDNVLASPAEKPRPKRTRRAQKAAEKAEEKPEIPPPTPKEEIAPQPEISSPILQKVNNKKPAEKSKLASSIPKAVAEKPKIDSKVEDIKSNVEEEVDSMDKTRIIPKREEEMDKTVVLPNGVYNHAPVTPKNICAMNETVVIEAATRETFVLDKPPNGLMNATVVIEKVSDPKLSEDNSLMTDDDSDVHTPPRHPPTALPTSAVKEKVQQFEELASRVTRTKTRAMAKKDEEPETQTPPDKIIKPVLSADTLQKMNSMIFNGKQPQISSSATKPRAIPPPTKSHIPASTSKISGINKMREAEESLKREKEDARKKKEAMLEAKRELQRKKREEKMAAAAAAREAAERERRVAMELAQRERLDKQAHADAGKMERLKEAERKKAELARKAAETEERRRAEEAARRQRLADEQRRALDARRKQLEDAAATKREAALMAKEIERRQKEYNEKQRKQRMEDKTHTPLKHHGSALEPAYMADGFQYLCSDEDEEPIERPVPEWSTSRSRKQQLVVQSQVRGALVDRLFSVRVHSPDLRAIFPDIERARLKRTSSAVWRTPPRLPPLAE